MRRRVELTVMKERKMNYILTGQMLLIMCCAVYLIWWYRGFRPNTNVSRVGGVNGLLLLVTAALGIAGLIFSLMPVPALTEPPVPALTEPPVPAAIIVAAGAVGYFVLLLVTKVIFHRVVTSELFLITGWTVLEMTVLVRLRAGEIIGPAGFLVMCAVIAAAFVISMILYVAYYKMEEMKAFYAAMVPLVTEAAAMAMMVAAMVSGR